MSYSQEAQEAILGAVLSGQVDSADVPLQAMHFHGRQHQTLWETCRKMSDRGMVADMISVVDHLPPESPLLEDQGIDYITSLAEDSRGVTTGIIETYTKMIRDHWARRYLKDELFTVVSDSDDMDLPEVLARIDSIGQAVDEGESDYAPDHKAALKQTIDVIDERHANGGGIQGLTTGLIDLDNKTNGFRPGDLIVLAARPSMGKTALAVNMMIAALQSGPVFFFSLEMPGEEIIEKMISSKGKINYSAILRGKMTDGDWPSLANAVNYFSEHAFRIDDRSGLTVHQVRAAIKRYTKDIGKPGLIMVDYLQLMSSGKKTENRTQEIGEISKGLKSIAKDLNVPVVALSQLNRGLESRKDKRPINSDLRESGNIEQDADLILFLYRDEVYDENTERPGVAEIIIGKARKGQIGKVYASWQGHFQRFDNLAHGGINHGE